MIRFPSLLLAMLMVSLSTTALAHHGWSSYDNQNELKANNGIGLQ